MRARAVRMTKMISTWVAIDWTNQAVWNSAAGVCSTP